MNDLHGRSLAGEGLLGAWAPRDRRRLVATLDSQGRTGGPIVVTAGAPMKQRPPCRFEILFAPLAAVGGEPRLIGLYQPLTDRPRGMAREFSGDRHRGRVGRAAAVAAPAPGRPRRPADRLTRKARRAPTVARFARGG